jgi:hypothetical protein
MSDPLDIYDPIVYYYITIQMFNDIILKDLNRDNDINVFVSNILFKAASEYESIHYHKLKNKLTFILDPGRKGLNYGYTYIGKENDEVSNVNEFFELN